jgi:hypothetical protein
VQLGDDRKLHPGNSRLVDHFHFGREITELTKTLAIIVIESMQADSATAPPAPLVDPVPADDLWMIRSGTCQPFKRLAPQL